MYYAVANIQSGEVVILTKSEHEAAVALTPGHCYGWHPEKEVAFQKARRWSNHFSGRKENVKLTKQIKRNKQTILPHRCPGCGGMIVEWTCPLCFTRTHEQETLA